VAGACRHLPRNAHRRARDALESMTLKRLVIAVVVIAIGVLVLARLPGPVPAPGTGARPGPSPTAAKASATQASPGGLPASTRFFVAKAPPGAERQIARLRSQGKDGDANLIEAMVGVPTATWLTGGSPSAAAGEAGRIAHDADVDGSVPVFVLYNVPGRDCSQASGGGASSGSAYLAWVEAIADALGDSHAIVLLEPDGVALLPSDCSQPDSFGRLHLIADAAHALRADTNARIYLDAGHSRWHPTAEISRRLVDAGVDRTDGFIENVANYQTTEQATAWGHWVTRCIWYGTHVQQGGFASCPNQFDAPNPDDPGTWQLIDALYADLVGDVPADKLPHFVVDTSRNGRGPWTPPPESSGDQQVWCNPPGRGVGMQPTTATNDPLVDAYLWVKVPGESDGPCLRGTAGPLDPVRKRVDPPAGEWFPEFALELARNADPHL
jgi:endoglucanase